MTFKSGWSGRSRLTLAETRGGAKVKKTFANKMSDVHVQQSTVRREGAGVAVSFRCHSRDERRALEDVLHALLALNDANVARLLSFVPLSGDSLSARLTFEHCGDSLYDWLHRGVPVASGVQLVLAHGIAAGMKALHAANILHMDLATRNVLVPANANNIGTPKVSFSRTALHATEMAELSFSAQICDFKRSVVCPANDEGEVDYRESQAAPIRVSQTCVLLAASVCVFGQSSERAVVVAREPDSTPGQPQARRVGVCDHIGRGEARRPFRVFVRVVVVVVIVIVVVVKHVAARAERYMRRSCCTPSRSSRTRISSQSMLRRALRIVVCVRSSAATLSHTRPTSSRSPIVAWRGTRPTGRRLPPSPPISRFVRSLKLIQFDLH